MHSIGEPHPPTRAPCYVVFKQSFTAQSCNGLCVRSGCIASPACTFVLSLRHSLAQSVHSLGQSEPYPHDLPALGNPYHTLSGMPSPEHTLPACHAQAICSVEGGAAGMNVPCMLMPCTHWSRHARIAHSQAVKRKSQADGLLHLVRRFKLSEIPTSHTVVAVPHAAVTTTRVPQILGNQISILACDAKDVPFSALLDGRGYEVQVLLQPYETSMHAPAMHGPNLCR